MSRNIPHEITSVLSATESVFTKMVGWSAKMLREANPGYDVSEVNLAKRLLDAREELSLPSAEIVIPLVAPHADLPASKALGREDKFVVNLTPYHAHETYSDGKPKVKFLWMASVPAMDITLQEIEYIGESIVRGVSTYWFFQGCNELTYTLLAVQGTCVSVRTFVNDENVPTAEQCKVQGLTNEMLVDVMVTGVAVTVALTLRNYNTFGHS